ncbi:hypothetical protein ABIE60_003275 [Marinobacterium sp. MBR-109]|jgi:hypothetical protein
MTLSPEDHSRIIEMAWEGDGMGGSNSFSFDQQESIAVLYPGSISIDDRSRELRA